MSYARLLLPSVISPSRVTYLDCDLIVLADVSQLSDTELDGSPVGAVVDSTIARSNDARLFLRLGLNGNDPYFNAGVMQMDLTMWREGSLFAECMEFAERYSNSLLSADQTILNFVLHSRFRALPETFNVPLYSSARRRLGEEFVQGQIYHLVGRPKPWDFLGEYLNQYSSDFSSHLKSTALATYRSHRNVSVSTVPRVFRMGKSYWKCLRAKLRRN